MSLIIPTTIAFAIVLLVLGLAAVARGAASRPALNGDHLARRAV